MKTLATNGVMKAQNFTLIQEYKGKKYNWGHSGELTKSILLMSIF